MTALKRYMQENTKDFGGIAKRTQIERSARKLFEMICATYEYDGIKPDSMYVAPCPNAYCGVSVSTDMDGFVKLSGSPARGRTENDLATVAAWFNHKPSDVRVGSYSDIWVTLKLPLDWESNEASLHDIALLCSKIFYSTK